MAKPAAMPMTLASVMPSIYQRSGISFFMSPSSPGLRSEPMNSTRLSRLARSWTMLRQVWRMPLLQGGVELGHHVVGDLRLVVPVGIVLGERDALALDGMADDGARPVGGERQALEHLAQRLDVVAVDVDGGEIEGAPFVE